MFYSPLRYPGGKSKLTAYVLETMKMNGLAGGTYVEPFAGGAAIAWYLLIEGHVRRVYINDLNLSIFAFWHSVLEHTDDLCKKIVDVDVTIEEWHRQRAIHNNEEEASLLDRGFATLFLNRTNRSGIIQGGVIGGLLQDGNYKLDCRFNKERIVKQVNTIASFKKQICLTNLDAVDFIETILPNIEKCALVNIDPPYYVKGRGLYQNFFKHKDHERLSKSVKAIKHPWMVTYDDTPEINDFYSEYNPVSFGLIYTAHEKRKGSEVIIHKPELKLCGWKPGISFDELRKAKKQLHKVS